MKSRLFLFLVFTCMVMGLQAQTVVGQYRYGTPGVLEQSVITSCADASGNVYVVSGTGTGTPYQIGQCITQKFNSAGVLQWTDSYAVPPDSEVFAKSIVVSATGQVTLAGTIQNEATLSGAVFLRALNPSGTSLWTVADATADQVNGLVLDASGNPILAESLLSGKANLVKYSAANHAVLWSQLQNFGTTPYIAFLSSDGASNCFEMVEEAASHYDVVKINVVTGASVWAKAYVLPSAVANLSLSYGVVTSSGDLVVAGTGQDAAYSYAVVTLDRVSATNGSFVYRKTLGGTAKSDFTSILGAPLADSSNAIYLPMNVAGTGPLLEKFSSSGAPAYSSSLPSETASVLQTFGAPGTVLAASAGGSGPRNFRLIGATGTVVWSASPSIALVPAGGFLSSDPSHNLVFVNTSKSTLGEERVGLLKLNGSTHATIFDLTSSASGVMDSDFSINAGHDASGNSYIVGTENFTPFAAKLGPTGTLLWKTYVGTNSLYFAGSSPGLASYSPAQGLVFEVESQTTMGLAKVSNTGQVLWTVGLPLPNGGLSLPGSLAMDSAGNVAVGYDNLGSPNALLIQHFNGGTGALQWERSFAVAYTAGQIAIDSSDNVYGVGSPIGIAAFLLVKISPSGVVLFNKNEPAGVYSFTAPAIAINPTSGNVYLGDGDLVPDKNMVNQGTIQLGCYDPGGNQVWQTSIMLTGFWGLNGVHLSYNPTLNSVVADCQAQSQSGHQPMSTFVSRVNASSGVTYWNNQYAIPNSTGQGAVLSFDIYNNIVLAGIIRYVYPGEITAFMHKIDALTGATRFTTTSFGTYTSPFTSISGMTIGADNRPILFGGAPSPTGPGSDNSLMVKLVFQPYSHGFPLKVSENGTLSGLLISSEVEDVNGGTFSIVTPPMHASSYSLTAAGVLSYKPLANYQGTDSLTYKVVNQYGTSQATISITVQ